MLILFAIGYVEEIDLLALIYCNMQPTISLKKTLCSLKYF